MVQKQQINLRPTAASGVNFDDDDEFHASLDLILSAGEDISDLAFATQTARAQVRFGSGATQALPDLCAHLGASRVMIASTRSGWARYRSQFNSINDTIVGVFDGAQTHCPENVVEEMRSAYREARADCVVAIGGGSSLGLGKIMVAEENAHFVALPTTYSGTEMTPIFGRKIGNEKRTKKDPGCMPGAVIYDAALSLSLPAGETAQSGMNSLAHSVEALYAANADALTEQYARIAITAHRDGLPLCISEPANVHGRTLAFLGAFLGGVLVERNGIALHHQLCHVLGGLYDLPHGVSNSAVLSHAIAYSADHAPRAMSILSDVLGSQDPAMAVHDLAGVIGAPRALADYGVGEDRIDEMVDTLLAKDFVNPRPLERMPLATMLQRIVAGAPPSVS